MLQMMMMVSSFVGFFPSYEVNFEVESNNEEPSKLIR